MSEKKVELDLSELPSLKKMRSNYATILFSNGDNFIKEITYIEPFVSPLFKTITLLATIENGTNDVATGISITITKEQWRKFNREIEARFAYFEKSKQAEGKCSSE